MSDYDDNDFDDDDIPQQDKPVARATRHPTGG